MCLKIVDDNGEPKICYHTVAPQFDENFKRFNTSIEGQQTAIYHTDSLFMSQSYNMESIEYAEAAQRSIDDISDISQIYNDIQQFLLSIKKEDLLDQRNYDWFKQKKEQALYYIKNHDKFNLQNILRSIDPSLFKNQDNAHYAIRQSFYLDELIDPSRRSYLYGISMSNTKINF